MNKKQRNITIVSVVGISILILLLIQFDPFSIAPPDDEGDTDDTEDNDEFPKDRVPPPPPPPEPIYPTNPSISINNDDETMDSKTVVFTLSCDDADSMRFLLYNDNWLSWVVYNEIYTLTLTQNGPNYPVYKVGVEFKNDEGTSEIVYDSITYVEYTPPIPILPTNPTILINDGDETTNSFLLTITLSCDDATQLRILFNDNWLSWVAYTEVYTILISTSSPDNTIFKIGVEFKNDEGTSEIVYDSIIYDTSVDDSADDSTADSAEPDEIDYTLIYVLVAVLGGGIGIVVFITYRKKKDKRIRYTTKKGKSRVIKPLKLKSK